MSKTMDALNDAIMHMRAGRIKRRTFLERVIALGLSAGAASSLLEACGTISTHCTPNGWVSQPNTIVWSSEHDDQEEFINIVKNFNTQNTNAHVIYNNAPFEDNSQYKDTVSALQVCASEMDVISIDVVWLTEFARNQWILPLTETIKSSVLQSYKGFQSIVDSCSYKGQLYSAPIRFDLGVLYYNTGFVSSAPQTYDELREQASQLLANSQGKELDGYVWQGAQYEGLVCNFIEVLAGFGGSFFAEDDPTKVTINSSEAHDALFEMVNWLWLATISPNDPNGITTYEENDARVRWQNGFAVFMRNWFNVQQLVTDPGISAVHDEVAYAAIPHSKSQPTGHSCIGGWQVGVNASSTNQDLSWQFIDFLLKHTKDYRPTDVVGDASLKSMYTNAVARPQLPNYNLISESIQRHVFSALTKRETPSEALAKMEDELKQIISKQQA
ncbi:extracellular solute-binding protein [Ktedonobacter robiniae]|uniref:ABC transporter substrate-binding protein n=1 Tax=Ktedonobacter robiniae TaxID=2778365 RepID=A0ABQ3UTD6_9CHLR|nr:extracellular solute-binding protein [Ktedonobacter robiniae]GHO55700.1 hypothetical protein KSB_41750 [Ktedonobacter robiniae]